MTNDVNIGWHAVSKNARYKAKDKKGGVGIGHDLCRFFSGAYVGMDTTSLISELAFLTCTSATTSSVNTLIQL
jgi:hypothetical protein